MGTKQDPLELDWTFFWKKYRWIGLLVGLRFRASVVYKDGVDLKVGPAGDKVCLCYV